MTWSEAILLGLLQGVSEFLPISSSGHLEIGTVLFGIKNSDNLSFALAVHCATVLATIVVFKKDIWNITKGVLKFRWNTETIFLSKIVISMLPVLFVGLFFKDFIADFFTGDLMLVGAMLIVTSVLLCFAHFHKKTSKPISFVTAFSIGLAQAIAVLPGISRSGATISTALLLGVDRVQAAKFSFLMVLIPILGATFLETLDYSNASSVSRISIENILLAFFAAFISGYFACKWMLAFVRKGHLIFFAVYCFLAGTTAILVA